MRRRTNARTFRVLVDHIDDCPAVAATERGDWDMPWVMLSGQVEWRNIYGTTGGRSLIWRWHRLKCNYTQCSGQAIVRADVLESAIAEEALLP